jgi:flagellar protein FlaG
MREIKPQEDSAKTLERALDNMKDKQDGTKGLGQFQPTRVTEEELRQTIDKLNHTVNLYNKQIAFEFHDDAKVLMARVINKETKEVITQLPPEELLDLVAKIKELVGALIDQKV